MKKIVYSLKKDEILYENEDGQLVDFAGEAWDRKNRFFRAMFYPLFVVSKGKKKTTKETNDGKN